MIERTEILRDDKYIFIVEKDHGFKNVRVMNKNNEFIYSISRAVSEDCPIEVKKTKKGKHTFYVVTLYSSMNKEYEYVQILVPMTINHISPIYNDTDFYSRLTTKIRISVSGAYFHAERISVPQKDAANTLSNGVDMSYDNFNLLCKRLQKQGVETGRIVKYNSTLPDICDFETCGSVQTIRVKDLVESIQHGKGTISNPSALKRWKGFIY